jgi:hypothetical protein
MQNNHRDISQEKTQLEGQDLNAAWRSSLLTVRWGLVLATAAILLGFCLGGAFGGLEEPIRAMLKAEGQGLIATVYHNNPDALDKTIDHAWDYLVRAHMHGGGIGSAALGLCLLLGFLPGDRRLRALLAGGLGLGALGYSSFWLLAGVRAPVLGSTKAAKESLGWLAIPSAGLLLTGVALTLLLIVWALWWRSATTPVK